MAAEPKVVNGGRASMKARATCMYHVGSRAIALRHHQAAVKIIDHPLSAKLTSTPLQYTGETTHDVYIHRSIMPGHLSAAEAPEDLWTCHDCGWTYPNHHPSAKHRRNHKKVCGFIPGFTAIISTKKATPETISSIIDGGSSDDASSDDEATPQQTHEKRGHHHTRQKVAPAQQTVAASGGTRAAKSLCVTHRLKDPCLHGGEANMKPAPLTERTFSDQNNLHSLQATCSTPNAPVKSQHVRRRSAHALEGVWVCRHCGWTYPNAHPSAKHRRKHKKKCPTLVVTLRHVDGSGGSSDDVSSDEDNKRGDAAPEMQEHPEMNISSLPTALEAFLGRSDSKRDLRELHDTIILLSPKPMSRRNSFKRREGPSGLLSPRGGIKGSKVLNSNQPQELVTGTDKKPQAGSDQENEDPVVLNLPAAGIVTARRAPVPESALGDTSLEGTRSSSDELDLNDSDSGETPSSPDSVLQPVHLLLSSITSTSRQEGTGDEVTEQPLHQEAASAAAALEVDAETKKDVKNGEHEPAPQLRPPTLTGEGSPAADTSESYPEAPPADQKGSLEASFVHSCEPVEASPSTELQTAITETTRVAKEIDMATGAGVQDSFSGWKYVASSLVVKPATVTAVKAHVELSALHSDIAPEHLSVEQLVVGGYVTSEAVPADNEQRDVQDGNAVDSKLECVNHTLKAEHQKAIDKNGSDAAKEDSEVLQSSAEAPCEVVKEKEGKDGKDAQTLNSLVLFSNQPPQVMEEVDRDSKPSSSESISSDEPSTEVTVKDKDKELVVIPSGVSSIHRSPVDCSSNVEDKNLPVFSSEGSAADHLSLDEASELHADKESELPAPGSENLTPSEFASQSNTLFSGVQVKLNTVLGSLDAAEGQITSSDTQELSPSTRTNNTYSVTLIPVATQSATFKTDAEPEEDLSSEGSASEKTKKLLYMKPALDERSSTAKETPELNSETLPTPKSQVVVTELVGDKDKEAQISAHSESLTTDFDEEKTTSSAAVDSHLSLGRSELHETLDHSGAAEGECKEVRGSDIAEASRNSLPDATGYNSTNGEIASKGADELTAEQQLSSDTEATSKLHSAGDRVDIDELKSDLFTVPKTQQHETSPKLVEVWEMNNDQVREGVHEKVTTVERTGVTDVVAPSTKSDFFVAEVTEMKIDEKIQAVSETKDSQGHAEAIAQKEIGEASSKTRFGDIPAGKKSLPETCDISVAAREETGTTRGRGKEAEGEVACHDRESASVTISQVLEVAGKEEAPVKQSGLFSQYKEKFNKLQREPSLKAREPQPTMIRGPGSGKRKLLPSLGVTFDNSPVVKNKKQEPRPAKDRGGAAQSSTQLPFKPRFTCRPARRTSAESPPSSPQRGGVQTNPEGIVKERIETYERLIGKTTTFGPVPAPSPTYRFSFSSGKPSSPHLNGSTVTTRHQLFEQEQAVSAEEKISAIGALLHHVEPKDTTKLQDKSNVQEEQLPEALSHLRHNNHNEQDSSSTEPEDPSQRISKVPLILRETAEACLSPVPRVTTAY